MISNFNELGISPPILKALEEMGFETPTEVQGKAIPLILNKEDLIVRSKTGSGKTAVFGVSMLQMTDPDAPGPQGLILTPTRELAVQVDSDLKLMSRHLLHKTAAVYGQHSMNVELQAFKKGVTIVTGTPGRVFDHIKHGNLTTGNIRFLVLDEADRMLDMGFLEQVVKIVKTLPKNRVTLLFSATIPSEVHRICRDYMKHPSTIEIESQTKTVDTIEQVYYRVDHKEKNTQLNRLLLIEQPESCLIFCNTRIAVDRVQNFLSRKGYASEALHGDIPQSKRTKTIEQFKQGEFRLLVATDVAARGIHIESLSLVINYDVPNEKDSYVHRIGRTGRAGKVGRSITLVTSEDIMSLYDIEEHIGVVINEGELPSEEDFNRCRAEAEKWIQANAIKVRPPQAHQDATSGGNQRRRKNAPSAQPKTSQYENRTDGIRADGNRADAKPPHARSGYQNENRRERYVNSQADQKGPAKGSAASNTERKADNRSRTAPYAERNVSDRTRTTFNQDNRANDRPRNAPYAERTKPNYPAAKQMTANNTTPGMVKTKPVIETEQNKSLTTKKPFFQRVLQRLFGK